MDLEWTWNANWNETGMEREWNGNEIEMETELKWNQNGMRLEWNRDGIEMELRRSGDGVRTNLGQSCNGPGRQLERTEMELELEQN